MEARPRCSRLAKRGSQVPAAEVLDVEGAAALGQLWEDPDSLIALETLRGLIGIEGRADPTLLAERKNRAAGG